MSGIRSQSTVSPNGSLKRKPLTQTAMPAWSCNARCCGHNGDDRTARSLWRKFPILARILPEIAGPDADRRRQAVSSIEIVMEREANLLEIIFALYPPRGFAGTVQK